MLSQLQIENLEREIQEKRKQMNVLDQRLNEIETGDSPMANSSLVEMQQVSDIGIEINKYRFEAWIFM